MNAVTSAIVIGALSVLTAMASEWASAAALPPYEQPAEWKNALGRDDTLVLPGFEPLALNGRRIELGVGRAYDWQDGLLPQAIAARGRQIATDMELVTRVNGVEQVVKPESFVVERNTRSRAEILQTATLADGVQVELRTRVAYDGIAIVDVRLRPAKVTNIDALALRVSVPRLPDTQIMAFEPTTIYTYPKPVFVEPCYRGPHKSVVAFIDNDTSFWWLQDEIDERLVDAKASTVVECTQDSFRLVQPLVSSRVRIGFDVYFRFAFMATPVREVPDSFRKERIAQSAYQYEIDVGNINVWWTDATAHYALPYLDYPPGAQARLPAADVNAYLGAARNRALVQSWRAKNLERLPYTSLRAMSALDPVATRFLPQWRVLPEQVTDGHSDDPYTVGFPRTLLSHRAPGFSDYLLFRLDEISSGLGVRGFYFDQAEPVGSSNPLHLTNASGASFRGMATDILALREFFERLATLLYKKGAPPLVYVHNSTTPIIPAYSFVTAMVQGEEANSELKNLNYHESMTLDRIRGEYTTAHFGVPTVWIEEVWSGYLAAQRPAAYRKAGEYAWVSSPEFRAPWRNFMSLALVHDIPVWTHAVADERKPLFRQLDRFGVAESRFLGYWELSRSWRDSSFLISAYVHRKTGQSLLVAVNRRPEPQILTPASIRALLDAPAVPAELREQVARMTASGLSVPGYDFRLIELR